MSAPVLVRDRAGLTAALAALGRPPVLVPTMGALHRGHTALLEAGGALGTGPVVASVFVNPLQFDSAGDLDAYPRDLDADLAVCARAGVAVVFAPTLDQMYPAGDPLVRVAAGPLGARYEGEARPGHFDGMLTVVAKLLGLVRPTAALFGRKDAQQLALVRRMCTDLDLGVDVVAVDTVYDADGLAVSSRNVRLSPEERGRALALPAALGAARRAGAAGGTPAATERAARDLLDGAGVEVDYVALVDPDSFEPVAGGPASGLLVAAVRVGGVRLLDNTMVGPDTGATGGER